MGYWFVSISGHEQDSLRKWPLTSAYLVSGHDCFWQRISRGNTTGTRAFAKIAEKPGFRAVEASLGRHDGGGVTVASIEIRKSKDGRVTTYRVKWRAGGAREGRWDGETFDDHREAKIFKSLVDAYGQQWPPPEVLNERGLGYLVADTPVPQPDVEAVSPPVVIFEDFAIRYVQGLVKPNPETKRKYLERLRVHVCPVIGARPIAEITRGDLRRWQQGLIGKLSGKTIQNIRGETVSPIFERLAGRARTVNHRCARTTRSRACSYPLASRRSARSSRIRARHSWSSRRRTRSTRTRPTSCYC